MAVVNSDDLGMALNARPGMRSIDVQFTATDVDVADVPETVSGLGGLVALRSAAAVLELVSSSAADAAAGTGARTVSIWGLDADWNELTEVVTLNGVTAVQTVGLFLRVNSVDVLTAGTGKTNAGRILIRDASAGTNRSAIEIARGRTEVGVFSVPRGTRVLGLGWLMSSRVATAGNSSCDLAFFVTKNGVRKLDFSQIIESMTSVNLGSAHVFDEMSDVEVVITRVRAADTLVSVHGHGVLVQIAGSGF